VNNPQNNQITGLFIPFTESELKKIYSFCDMFGYPINGFGVKEMLLEMVNDEMLEENQKEKRAGTISDVASIFIEHPEIIGNGISMVKQFVAGMKKAPR
jgi:hypothetical protein